MSESMEISWRLAQHAYAQANLQITVLTGDERFGKGSLKIVVLPREIFWFKFVLMYVVVVQLIWTIRWMQVVDVCANGIRAPKPQKFGRGWHNASFTCLLSQSCQVGMQHIGIRMQRSKIPVSDVKYTEACKAANAESDSRFALQEIRIMLTCYMREGTWKARQCK